MSETVYDAFCSGEHALIEAEMKKQGGANIDTKEIQRLKNELKAITDKQNKAVKSINEKLVEIDVILSDLKLSCLCSKYSLPDELRLINVANFQKSLQDFKDGKFQM